MCALCGPFWPSSITVIEFPAAIPPSGEILGQAPPALQACPSQGIKLSGRGASVLGLINRLFYPGAVTGQGQTGREVMVPNIEVSHKHLPSKPSGIQGQLWALCPPRRSAKSATPHLLLPSPHYGSPPFFSPVTPLLSSIKERGYIFKVDTPHNIGHVIYPSDSQLLLL